MRAAPQGERFGFWIYRIFPLGLSRPRPFDKAQGRLFSGRLEARVPVYRQSPKDGARGRLVKAAAVVAGVLVLAASADRLDCRREVDRCLTRVHAKAAECARRCDSRYYDHFASWGECNDHCRREADQATAECNRVYDRCASPEGRLPH